MPQTVPSRPTNGAVEPTVANRTCPNCRRCSTRCKASRSTRVSCWERSPAAASVWGAACSMVRAACNRGNTRRRGSKARKRCCASSRCAACQKAAVDSCTSFTALRSIQLFQKITTQLATDIANSNRATLRLIASPCSTVCHTPIKLPSGWLALSAVRARHTCRTARSTCPPGNAPRAGCPVHRSRGCWICA
ncbi:hypothetical protein D9M69_566020 [compost metagenome]